MAAESSVKEDGGNIYHKIAEFLTNIAEFVLRGDAPSWKDKKKDGYHLVTGSLISRDWRTAGIKSLAEDDAEEVDIDNPGIDVRTDQFIKQKRVVRGGCWGDVLEFTRAACRDRFHPEFHNDTCRAAWS